MHVKILSAFYFLGDVSAAMDYVSLRVDYPIDEALALCEKYKHAEACAFLHERCGNYEAGLDVLLQGVMQSESPMTSLIKCVDLCTRAVKKLNDQDGLVLWKSLFLFGTQLPDDPSAAELKEYISVCATKYLNLGIHSVFRSCPL